MPLFLLLLLLLLLRALRPGERKTMALLPGEKKEVTKIKKQKGVTP
jgi:hypothetical protein